MHTTNSRHRDGPDRNAQSLIRVATIGAICLLLASMAPPGLVAASLSSLLFIGALVSLAIGALQGERLFPEHLTRWDEAATFFLTSMMVAALVDADEVRRIGEGVQGW